jgi:hypothetical protein
LPIIRNYGYFFQPFQCPYKIYFRVTFGACAGSIICVYLPLSIANHIVASENRGCVPKADDLHISLSDVNGEETNTISDSQHSAFPALALPYVAQGD